jgi:hypothetical protein
MRDYKNNVCYTVPETVLLAFNTYQIQHLYYRTVISNICAMTTKAVLSDDKEGYLLWKLIELYFEKSIVPIFLGK